LFAEETGIWGGLKMKNLYANPDFNPYIWDDVLLDACVSEPKLTLLLNAHARYAEMDGGRIKFLKVTQLTTEAEIDIYGDVFIDCTGDGSIAASAGVPFIIGGEESNGSSSSFPVKTQGNSILYSTRDTGKPTRFVVPSYAHSIDHIESLLNRGGRIISEKSNGCDLWWFEYGGENDTIADSEDIALELKRLLMGVWGYIKNSGKFEAENLALDWIGSLPGKRESRRMKAEKTLAEEDLLSARTHPDAVFYGGWYMDFHPPEGIYSEKETCIQIPVNVYQVPFGCLYNKKVDNLLFAGRIIGVSPSAFASTRIMNTCALSGQAAGTAASLASLHNLPISEIASTYIRDLQTFLIRDDVLIPYLDLKDPADLAKAARVAASGCSDGKCGPPVGLAPIEKDTFAVLPGNPVAAPVELLVTASQDGVLSGTWHDSPLPSRRLLGKPIQGFEVPVKKGSARWISLPAPAAQGFLSMSFDSAPGISIHLEERQRTGFLFGSANSSEYFYPCIETNIPIYTPSSVIDSIGRPWAGPGAWVADTLDSPWIELSWDAHITAQEARIYFNPDFSLELATSLFSSWEPSHIYTARKGMPPQLVKNYSVYVKTDDGWELAESQEENWRRMAIIRLPEKPFSSLKISIKETYGAPAEIFKVSVYPRANGA
jgi:hypothetical protein